MHRRAVLRGLIFCALGMPRVLEAQPPRQMYRIGVLSPGGPPAVTAPSPLEDGLRDLGLVEGKNLVIDRRFASGNAERLNDFAADLVRLKMDVIVTYGTNGAMAASNATTKIPIVMAVIGDPVRVGLVKSLARPGGNITGNSLVAPELGGKRLEILKEALPRTTRVAVLVDPANPAFAVSRAEQEQVMRSLGVQPLIIEVSRADELEIAVSRAAREGADALVLYSHPMFFSGRSRLVEAALKERVPTMAEGREFVEAGALMSYAPGMTDLNRRAATYVHRILGGVKPGDLPIEQPTKFELVINLKTARALGLTIPPSLLLRADEVIE